MSSRGGQGTSCWHCRSIASGPPEERFRESSRGDKRGFPQHTAAEQESIFPAGLALQQRLLVGHKIAGKSARYQPPAGFFRKSARSGNDRMTAQDFPHLQ